MTLDKMPAAMDQAPVGKNLGVCGVDRVHMTLKDLEVDELPLA